MNSVVVAMTSSLDLEYWQRAGRQAVVAVMTHVYLLPLSQSQ